MRLPVIGPFYVRAALRALERAPRGKLSPEMQQMQAMLKKIPPGQREALLRAAVKGDLPAPEPGQMSRSMRRAAQKQARRKP